jgi:hypothetical protein
MPPIRRPALTCLQGNDLVYRLVVGVPPIDRPGGKRWRPVTDQEKQKAEQLISSLEVAVGQVFPRDGGNATLITNMIQSLNGLRSVLGLVRPH